MGPNEQAVLAALLGGMVSGGAQQWANDLATKKQQEEAALKQQGDLPPQPQYIQKGNFLIRTNYTVRLIPERRDCLWRIAEYKFIYGDPWKWPVIYKANKEEIGSNPHLIFPGQVFDIPALDEQGNPLLPGAQEKESTTVDEPGETPANTGQDAEKK